MFNPSIIWVNQQTIGKHRQYPAKGKTLQNMTTIQLKDVQAATIIHTCQDCLKETEYL